MARVGVLLRLSPEERMVVERAAGESGLPVAKWMREAVVAQAKGSEVVGPKQIGAAIRGRRGRGGVGTLEQLKAEIRRPLKETPVRQEAPVTETGLLVTAIRCTRHKALARQPSVLCGPACREEWG